MWETVLLMAVIAGLGAQRIAAVVFMLSKTDPVRLLLAYVAGGFAMTLIVGGVILFVLAEAGVDQSSVVPAEIEIAVGMLALLVAALVGSGRAASLRARSRLGRERMPRRVQAALESESPWIASVTGVMFGLPNFYLLAAIAAMIEAGADASTQVNALVVFSFVAFLQAEIPLASFVAAPNPTRECVNRLYAWLTAHYRPVVTTLATGAGLYLVIRGISSL
jgi:Sap, sulfolipid-1-addressing protein